MKKRPRRKISLAVALLAMSLAVLACLGSGGEAAPTLYVIPTLTPSVSPTLTLFLSPTTTPSQTPEGTVTPVTSATPLIGATSTPSSPVSAPAQTGNLNIQYFIPTPTSASPGGSVTLAWATSGATQATVFRVGADGSFGQSWPVDTTGTLTVTASSGTGTVEKFVLRISDGLNIQEAEATISLSCSRSWFFTQTPPSSCPAAAEVSTQAAEQGFEHGWIYWMQTTGKMYVLYEDGQSPAWEVYSDTWSTSEPESDPNLTPPAGLTQPVRGIGKVWRTNTTVRDRLGWGEGSEVGYTASFQQEAGSDPQNIFFTEPGKLLTRLENGGSSWKFGETVP